MISSADEHPQHTTFQELSLPVLTATAASKKREEAISVGIASPQESLA
jgi:hypothetical protein